MHPDTRILSVNVGQPREIQWRGETVTTSIFKEAVSGPVMLHRLNLAGDKQADLTVHGGVNKAVYLYPSEHYPYWQDELPDTSLAWGMFGENLTSTGLLEATVHIGDQFRIGAARLVVTEPRVPCYKLGIRFGRPDMVKRFLASRRSGFYCAVLEEGLVQAGDIIERIHYDQWAVTIDDFMRASIFKSDDIAIMQRIVQIETLSDGWRSHFLAQLAALQ
jgi:MOSC domain-containing protein YiiM